MTKLTVKQKRILKVTVDLIKEGKPVSQYKVANLAGVNSCSVYSLFNKISNLK